VISVTGHLVHLVYIVSAWADTFNVHKLFNFLKHSDELTVAHRVKLEITRLHNDITGCLDNGVDLSQLRSRQSLMLLNIQLHGYPIPGQHQPLTEHTYMPTLPCPHAGPTHANGVLLTHAHRLDAVHHQLPRGTTIHTPPLPGTQLPPRTRHTHH
jgi:hypothetical protein